MKGPSTLWSQTLAGELAELRQIFADYLQARTALFRLEAADARQQVQRLVVCAAVAGIFGLSVLPLVCVAVAYLLDGTWGLRMASWVAIFALICGLTAGGFAVLAALKVKRKGQAFSQSLAELREDIAWLQDWRDRLQVLRGQDRKTV